MNQYTRSYYNNSFFKFVQCHWLPFVALLIGPVVGVSTLYWRHVLTPHKVMEQIFCTIGLVSFILICLVVKWKNLRD